MVAGGTTRLRRRRVSEGTKVTLSGLLLLAASLIGFHGLYAAVFS